MDFWDTNFKEDSKLSNKMHKTLSQFKQMKSSGHWAWKKKIYEDDFFKDFSAIGKSAETLPSSPQIKGGELHQDPWRDWI